MTKIDQNKEGRKSKALPIVRDHRNAIGERSISKVVSKIIESDVALQDALRRGYGNFSAIARIIKPKVEEMMQRDVKLQSIITAVKRAKGSYGRFFDNVKEVIAKSIINVRTDVVKLSIEKTRRSLATIRNLLAEYQEEFLQVSESISAITIVFDQKLFNEIRSIFKKEDILEEKTNLAAIIVRSPKEIAETPGCIATFYNQLSRRQINIDDTTSCFTDTIMVVKMEDVGAAFSALTELISEARR
jgi:aspartokinase